MEKGSSKLSSQRRSDSGELSSRGRARLRGAGAARDTHPQLLQAEAAAGAHLGVVAHGGAAHDGPHRARRRPGGDTSRLRLPGLAPVDRGRQSPLGSRAVGPGPRVLASGPPTPTRAPADLPRRLVEPRGHPPLPVLVEVWLQDHAIPAGRHGCCLLDPGAGRGSAGSAVGPACRPSQPTLPRPSGSPFIGTMNVGPPMPADAVRCRAMEGHGRQDDPSTLTSSGENSQQKGASAARDPGMVGCPANQKSHKVLANGS